MREADTNVEFCLEANVEKLVESHPILSLLPPSCGTKTVACGMQQKLYVGWYLGHDDGWCRRINVETDGMLTVGLQFAVFLERSHCCRGYSSPTSSSCPSPVCAMSALCHESRLEKVRCDNQLFSVF